MLARIEEQEQKLANESEDWCCHRYCFGPPEMRMSKERRLQVELNQLQDFFVSQMMRIKELWRRLSVNVLVARMIFRTKRQLDPKASLATDAQDAGSGKSSHFSLRVWINENVILHPSSRGRIVWDFFVNSLYFSSIFLIPLM